LANETLWGVGRSLSVVRARQPFSCRRLGRDVEEWKHGRRAIISARRLPYFWRPSFAAQKYAGDTVDASLDLCLSYTSYEIQGRKKSVLRRRIE